jgi:phosphoribosylformylglycinamidine synthase
VVQVRREHTADVLEQFNRAGLGDCTHRIGSPNSNHLLEIDHHGTGVFRDTLQVLQRLWSETSFHMRALRDNPACAREEFDTLLDSADPGLTVRATFSMEAPPSVTGTARPRVAILREQGVNGQVEMAAAFDLAGFDAVDVHMSDILAGRIDLKDFKGLAACGGFSYGDVLGAGGGWAKSILYNDRARDQFGEFFHRADSFALGVCNGCQMLSHLKDLIPGTAHWPSFLRNRSEQFEARLVMVEVLESDSVLFREMAGSRLPVVVAHGEGRAQFASDADADQAVREGTVCLRYVDNHGAPAAGYPYNPNGSRLGITGLAGAGGRVTILMPHPERVFLSKQYSWLPPDWHAGEGPWFKLFQNARRFVA